MTWLQIKEQAELYRRDTVVYPKRWFNEGKALLASMYPSACKRTTITVDVTDNSAPITLPTTCRYVQHVVPTDDPSFNYTRFSTDILSNEIRFGTLGSFVVTCLSEAADIVGTDSEISEIHSAYHYPLAKYIAAKEVEYIRPDWYQQLMAQFIQEAAIANNSLKRGSVGITKTPRRRFR